MEQRRLRLGDILDDYCPRERRVTNHAIVAMIDDDIKQTRCTTCDAEHPYKGGKEPRKRKKDTPAALYREVLAGLDPEAPAGLSAPAPMPSDPDVPETPVAAAGDEPASKDADPVMADLDPDAAEPPAARPELEEGPVHRPLIRATLPRAEGQKETRPLPEFTVRYPGNRANGKHRDRSRGPGGNRPHGQGNARFAGSRGNGRGFGGRSGPGGFRSSSQSRHGGRKRSR